MDKRSAKTFLNTVEVFGTFSGLKLNKEKTEAMWLGSLRHSNCKPLGIRWPDEPLRMLGIYISYDEDLCKEKNFRDKIVRMKNIINTWKGRNLTMLGRVQIIKSFLISQLTYVSSVLDIPADILKDINKLVFNFVWDGRRDKICRSTLKRELGEGGLKIPDVETLLQTSKIKWIKRLFSGPQMAWQFFLSTYLSNVGIHLNILKYANFDMKSLNIRNDTLPVFYQKMLKLWAEVGDNTHNKQSFLWYNKLILINHKSFLYENIFNARHIYGKRQYIYNRLY